MVPLVAEARRPISAGTFAARNLQARASLPAPAAMPAMAIVMLTKLYEFTTVVAPEKILVHGDHLDCNHRCISFCHRDCLARQAGPVAGQVRRNATAIGARETLLPKGHCTGLQT